MGSGLCPRALKWRAWSRWYQGPRAPSCSHDRTMGSSWPLTNKGPTWRMSPKAWCPSKCGDVSHRPPVRFPGGPRWLQLPDFALRWSQRAGWHNGRAARWWHSSNLLWATPLESTPHSQPQFMPRKIPWLLNFSGATVTSCGLILSVLYMEMFIPVYSASACAGTGSLNSSGIHGHLLSTPLDPTAE